MRKLLTPQIYRKIKTCVQQGQNVKETAKTLGFSENTVREWFYNDSYKIAKNIRLWKVEAMLKEAEKVSKEILALNSKNWNGKVDAKVLAVQQKEAQFLREKLVKAREFYCNSSKVSKMDRDRKPVPILEHLEMV